MKSFLLHLKKLDWILFTAAFLLVVVGLLSIYSGSFVEQDFFNFKKQIIFFAVGFSLMIIISFFDWRILRDSPYLILVFYFVCLLLLIGLFFFAQETRGVRAWYKLGPISIDPIEPTKLILIILLARYFSSRHIEMYRIQHIFLSGLYILIPSILIFRQPDMGSVLILFSLWVGILIISGIKLRHFLLLCLIGLIVLGLSWSFLLKDYQKQRIISFLEPQFETLGIGWSQSQSKIAIGSGGILGQGFMHGGQTQYGFLPESQTDFIFASIAEEGGLIGVIILLFLFSVLIWRIMRIAILANTNFPRLFTSGLTIIFISQIFIHIGMNTGILPIIGISLPLVSYGGGGLIITFIGLGILQSIKSH